LTKTLSIVTKTIKSPIDQTEIFFHEKLDSFDTSIKKMYVVGRLVWDVCIGLYYMHMLRVSHLDIKPDNIVVSSKGGGKAMLIDFNSVESFDDDTKLMDVCGTKAYESYESHRGDLVIPEKYDMYALGATIYTLYYGKLIDFDGIEYGVAPEPILRLMKGLMTQMPEDRWNWDDVFGCELFKS
jgi:serine/threonine protein kinase